MTGPKVGRQLEEVAFLAQLARRGAMPGALRDTLDDIERIARMSPSEYREHWRAKWADRLNGGAS